jgi:CheY-like chemotaxis protein
VDVAGDGQQALYRLERFRYDLIFMDCHMPTMDGYTATRKIRDLGGHHATVPIVALTASITPGERERCLAAGMTDYLAKPIGCDMLAACFQRWLPAAGGGDAVSAVVAAEPAGAADGEPAAPAVFDLAGTLARIGGDEALLLDLIEAFQQEARETIQEIRDTLERRNAQGLRAGAHKLKGALGSVGGAAARAAAERLERVALAGDLAPAGPQLDALAGELARFDSAVQAYLVDTTARRT